MSLSSNGTSNGSKKPAPELIGLLRGIDNCVEGIPILKNERLTIGRYKKCDLRIDLSIITEVHAIVHTVTVNTSTDFQIVLPIITDVSQNGTYLNKRLIGRKHSAMLFSGCVVQLVHEDIQFYYISAKDLFPPVPGHLIVKNILICPERLQKRKAIKDKTWVYDMDWDVIRLTKIIGSGQTSVVYPAIPFGIPKGLRNFQLACKVIECCADENAEKLNRLGRGDSRTRKERFDLEVEILKACRNPFIPHFVGQYVVDITYRGSDYKLLHLFTPMAFGGTLKRVIERARESRKVLESGMIGWVFYQLLDGVQHLHSLFQKNGQNKLYINGDIKPENILIMEDNKRPHVVITDFGHAVGIPVESVLDKDQEIPPKFTSCQGTIAYFSPERLDDKHCWTIEDHLYVDIWPLGVILYEMVALEHPFVPPAENNSDGSHENGFNENESIKQNIRNVNLRFDQKCWHDNEKRKAMDIIRKILRKKPQKEKLEMTMKDKRPTIRQLMQHPFVVPPHDSTNHKRLQQAWLQYDRDELLYRHQIERLYDEMIEIAPISGSYVQKIRKGRQKDGAISMKQHDKERAEALEPVINEMVHLVNGGGVEEWMVADGKDTFDQDEQLAIEAQAARDNLDHEQQDIQMENGIPEEQSAPMMID